MAMKFSSFLLGGLVGAAAVVYLNNKSKSMLFSSFAGNHQSLGNVMGKTKDLFKDSAADSNSAKSKPTVNEQFNKEDPFKTEGMEQIQNLVKEDSGLQSTVSEILAESNHKESHSIQ